MENQFSASEEIIDLEAYAREGKTPPRGRKYRIIVQGQQYVVQVDHMTGRQILELAGKTPPERFQLSQRVRRNKQVKQEAVKLDQVVDFTEPGVEKFMVLPLDVTEGQRTLRRQFVLPEEDTEGLNELGVEWEAINDGFGQVVLIHDYPLPAGFVPASVTVAIRIEPGYPSAPLDMAYFFPPISREDDQPIGAISPQVIDGNVYQRWSRHRTGVNAWQPGIDNVLSHFALVGTWFELEFTKRARLHAVPA